MMYLFTLGSGHSSENTYGEINISVEVTNVISILSYFGDLCDSLSQLEESIFSC